MRLFASLWLRAGPLGGCWRAALSLLLLVLLSSRPAWAKSEAGSEAESEPCRWDLRDPAGHSWGLVLFQPSAAADPADWRLRLTLRAPVLSLSHRRPLKLDDGLGRYWQLRNRSDELVPRGAVVLPEQSAQFDLAGLQPRPSEALPLHLQVPLVEGVQDLMLGAEPVAALSGLPIAAASP